jgi:hypothetical protein
MLRRIWPLGAALLVIAAISLPAHAHDSGGSPGHSDQAAPSQGPQRHGRGALPRHIGGGLRERVDSLRNRADSLPRVVEDQVADDVSPPSTGSRSGAPEDQGGEQLPAKEDRARIGSGESAPEPSDPQSESRSGSTTTTAPPQATADRAPAVPSPPAAGVPPAQVGAGQQTGPGPDAASPRRRGSGSAQASGHSASVGGSAGGIAKTDRDVPGRHSDPILLAAAPTADQGGGAEAAADRPPASGGAQAPSSSDDESTNTVEEIVEVVPDALWVALAALAALSLIFGGGYLIAAHRARRLAKRRQELLEEVGLLQTALLPPVPGTVGAVRASVAYRPSDGPGAGGDFYDALTLSGGRAAFILGDVSGHGREALAHTAFMRYSLRAYLGAGLEPRVALQVAERAMDGQLGGDFATVIVAVHDPADSSLTYASAGHPAPIIAGAPAHDPILTGWSPPIGWGLRTGLRQTTLALPAGAVACLYTDGLSEAGTVDGILGRPRLAEILAECGSDATAADVLDRVAKESVALRDDMAACLIAPASHARAGAPRVELFEVGPEEVDEGLVGAFLEECGAPAAYEVERETRLIVESRGNALLEVRFGPGGPHALVEPTTVQSIETAAARRASTARRA